MHAARRVDEMDAARDLLLELGVEPRDHLCERRLALSSSREQEGVRVEHDGDAHRSEVRPSERARLVVEGAYDLHIHVAPDVPRRRIDDVALAQRFAEVGLAGFGLKSHYTSTAERAQIVSAAVPGVRAIGTLSCSTGRSAG